MYKCLYNPLVSGYIVIYGLGIEAFTEHISLAEVNEFALYIVHCQCVYFHGKCVHCKMTDFPQHMSMKYGKITYPFLKVIVKKKGRLK